MDFSDYLRRKKGQAVYANYHAQESVNSTACLANPSNLSCSSQIKPKSFADAYDIAQGSSTGGCGYSISENGVFSYVPKCAPSEYTDITGSVDTGFSATQGNRGIFIIYSNDGTPLYSFLNTSYIDSRVNPSTIQIGSLYTSTNYYTNMVQTLSNWEPASKQPIQAPAAASVVTLWGDNNEPETTLCFNGMPLVYNISGGVKNEATKINPSGNKHILNMLETSEMKYFIDGVRNTSYTNDYESNYQETLLKLSTSNTPIWNINYKTDTYGDGTQSSTRSIFFDTDYNENVYVSYSFDTTTNNTSIPEANGGTSSLTGLLSNEYSFGFDLVKYNSSGTGIWGSTINFASPGRTPGNSFNFKKVCATSNGNIYNLFVYGSNDVYSTPIFYNSNASSNIPPLPSPSIYEDLTQFNSVIASYTNDGTFAWASAIVGLPLPSATFSLAVSSDSNSYVCGSYTGYNYFYNSNGTVSSISNVYTPYQAGYVAKFNNSGTPQWAISFTVNYFDPLLSVVDYGNIVKDISLDAAGNIYAVLKTGTCNARIYSNNTLVTGLAVSNLGYSSVNALAKIDTNGQIQWISAINPTIYANNDYATNMYIVSGGTTGDVGIGGTIGGGADGLICYNGAGAIKLSNTTRL